LHHHPFDFLLYWPHNATLSWFVEEYETKTRGHRVNPAARPVGEGVYTLVRHHSGTRTDIRLVYKLEYPGPHKKHEPQDALNIEDQASYIIQVNDAVKNAWICMLNNSVRYLGIGLVLLFAPWEPGN
jgi:hypothetical protein